MQKQQELGTTAQTPSPAQRVEQARAAFDAGRTRPVAWRKAQLNALARLCREQEAAIAQALTHDLGKAALESWSAEIRFTEREAQDAVKHLDGWMKAKKVSTPMIVQPGRSEIRTEPLGVVLVIAPWNYPFQLAMSPVVGALAAGNAVVIKPSEVSSATSRLIADLVPQYLDREAVHVVEGGVPETTELLQQRFDHIFYTGNGHVGRIVMRAAAENLTPVTLELGGKSPCVVSAEANLEVSARRIIMGKFFNAGQTCVAPDYVLVERPAKAELLAAMKRAIEDFYGKDPSQSDDYGRIINERHHGRLLGLLNGESIVYGGEHDVSDRYIAPTLVDEPAPDSAIMQEEIFGPLLPVIAVDSVDAAVRFINGRDKPLALYVFARDRAISESVLERTSSGGATVNHVWLHLAVPELPFGGVGESGMGAYHGERSYLCFSHERAVLRKGTAIDPPITYPPFDESKKKWIRRLL